MAPIGELSQIRVQEYDTMSHLFAIIPTYRRPMQLAETLGHLRRQSRPPDHVVVVDNSPDGDVEDVVRAARIPSLRYICPGENMGFAGGVAVGMEDVLEQCDDADWVVLMDDDDPLPWNSLLGDLERFGEDMIAKDSLTASVGLVGARFDWRKGGLRRIPDEELDGPVAVDFIGGNHFPFYRAAALRAEGVFSRDIFFGLSEIEHGLRMRAAGYSIYAHGTLWRKRRSEADRLRLEITPDRTLAPLNWRRYYSLRNVIYILRSYGKTSAAIRVTALKGFAKPLANLPRNPRLSTRYLAMNTRACLDGWRGRMGRTLEPDGSARPE